MLFKAHTKQLPRNAVRSGLTAKWKMTDKCESEDVQGQLEPPLITIDGLSTRAWPLSQHPQWKVLSREASVSLGKNGQLRSTEIQGGGFAQTATPSW